MTARHMAGALVATLLLAATARGATVTYNFDSGLGSDFTTANTGQFTVGTTGTINISKPADNPTIYEFISGGIVSTFVLSGDFTATIDVALNNFPAPNNASKLNEAMMHAQATIDPNGSLSLLRYRTSNANRIEGFSSIGPVGDQNEASTSGRFRMIRVGSNLDAYYDAAGDADFGTEAGFEHIAHFSNATDAYRLGFYAIQGSQALNVIRSGTELSISFDNLVLTTPDAAIPEPATLALLGLGLAGLGLTRRRRRSVS